MMEQSVRKGIPNMENQTSLHSEVSPSKKKNFTNNQDQSFRKNRSFSRINGKNQENKTQSMKTSFNRKRTKKAASNKSGMSNSSIRK